MEDPSCEYHLDWLEKPDSILLMKKFRDTSVTMKFKEIARWLIEVISVYIYSVMNVMSPVVSYNVDS